MNNDKRRYLIVGAGRSGSSLLSAILADAGASFGLPNLLSWDRKSGAYEHPRLHSAYKWFSRSQKIAKSMLPDKLGRKYCESRMLRELSAMMANTSFAKSTTLVWLVHPIYQLGYEPKIIVIYRRFQEYSVSRYLKFGWSLSDLTKAYCETYRNALLQLTIFGGCAVTYEELTNPEEEIWAEVIASLTGLSCRRILESRGKRVAARPRQNTLPVFEPGTQMIYSELLKLKGKVVDPIR